MREEKIIIDGIETNYSVREDGTVWNLKTNKQVKGTLERNEYHSVQLTIDGKRKSIMTHRLVAQAFCKNPNNYNTVHHIDGNPHNDNANNLEWVTLKKNAIESDRKESHKKPIYKEVQLDENWKCLSWIDEKFYISRNGEVWNSQTKNILNGTERNGYKRVDISGKRYSIHCLVFEAFNGYCPRYIDHIDGNRANNNLENLRPVTQSENMDNAMAHGHKCQVPLLQLDKEGNLIKEYPSIQAAADELGVSRRAIASAISRNGTCKGYIWKKKNDII